MNAHPTSDPADSSAALRAVQIGQHVLFAVLLGIAAVRAQTVGAHPAATLTGAALLAGWYAAGAVLATRRPSKRTGYLWLAGLVIGWLALVALSVEFSWVAFALFFLSMHLLPVRAGVVVVAGLTVAVVASQLTNGVGAVVPRVVGPCLGALVSVGMALAFRRLVIESEQRRHLVQQLVAAQDDLVATHDELASTQREAGGLAERARLARDIHDTLAQGFSSIVLLSRAGLAGSADVATLFAQIESTAADNLEEARRVVHALAPAQLETAPLPAAIGRLVGRLAEQTGMQQQLTIDGDPRAMPTTHEVAFLRLAQGALANIRLHSHASRVAVTLTYREDEVRLDVVDDGRGFDPAGLETAPLGGTGFGLRAMRDRLADVGGALIVESCPGGGAAIAATIPSKGTPS